MAGQVAPGQDAPGWLLGRVAGVPVYVAQSWLLVAAAITVLFGSQLAGTFGPLAYAVGLGYALALFLAVLVHEAAHALAARLVGLPPTHIVLTFWGGHTQFESEAVSPGRSVWVAVAGPLANAGLAALSFAVLGPVQVATGDSLPARLLLAFTVTNALLGAFNLLPGLPLDGGRVLEAVVWRITGRRGAGTVAAGWGGRVVAVLVVGYALLPLLRGGSLRVVTLVWAALVGAMLWSAAGQAIRGAGIRSRAERVDLRSLMRPARVVPVGTTLAALDAHPAAPGTAVVVADAVGGPVGVLDPEAARAVDPSRRGLVGVEQVARRHPASDVLDVSRTGDDLIADVQRVSGSEALVLEAGRVVGVVPVALVVQSLLGARTRGRAARRAT